MKKVLIASNNKEKIRELNAMLSKYNIVGVGIYDYFGRDIDIVEDGKTYLQNAVKKATAMAEIVDIPVIADDSGIEVEAMKGDLGVYSARFMKKHLQEIINNVIINNCKREKNYNCRYSAYIVIMYPDKSFSYGHGIMNGKIVTTPVGENGFAFDPIFFYEPLNKTIAQMTLEEKNTYSHRAIAIKQLEEFIKLL